MKLPRGVSVLIRPAIQWSLAIELLELTWRRFLSETVIPGLVPALLTIAAGFTCKLLFAEIGLAQLVLGVLTCLIVYAGAVVAMLKPADRADLQRVQSNLSLKSTHPPVH